MDYRGNTLNLNRIMHPLTGFFLLFYVASYPAAALFAQKANKKLGKVFSQRIKTDHLYDAQSGEKLLITQRPRAKKEEVEVNLSFNPLTRAVIYIKPLKGKSDAENPTDLTQIRFFFHASAQMFINTIEQLQAHGNVVVLLAGNKMQRVFLPQKVWITLNAGSLSYTLKVTQLLKKMKENDGNLDAVMATLDIRWEKPVKVPKKFKGDFSDLFVSFVAKREIDEKTGKVIQYKKLSTFPLQMRQKKDSAQQIELALPQKGKKKPVPFNAIEFSSGKESQLFLETLWQLSSKGTVHLLLEPLLEDIEGFRIDPAMVLVSFEHLSGNYTFSWLRLATYVETHGDVISALQAMKTDDESKGKAPFDPFAQKSTCQKMLSYFGIY